MLFGYKIAAVCMAKLYEDRLREFLQTLHNMFKPEKWRIFVYTTGSDLFWNTKSDIGEKMVFELIRPEFIDAVILMGDTIKNEQCIDELCSHAEKHHIPLFMLCGEREHACNINFDYSAGFAKVIQHLIDCHHIRDFHMIAGIKDNSFSDERIAVMRKVLEENGLTLDENHISYGDFWAVPAREATERLIAENRLPEAIVCANDTMAIAVCTTLAQHGIQVPRDIIVTGFDGIDAIWYSVPKVTSCKCDYEELGQKTAELLFQCDRNVPLPEHVWLVPKPVLLESCGCHHVQIQDTVDFINNLNDSFTRFQREGEDLSEISAKIQLSSTVEEVAEQLSLDTMFYNMTCMLKTECLDVSLDPMKIHSETAFGDELYILCDSDMHQQPEQPIVSADTVIPRLKELLDGGMPLIFTALHSVHIPMGYLCFHFWDFNRQNYVKINQTAMVLNAALSVFRNMRYQHHLQSVLEELYQFDSLTGLYSRKAFYLHYQQILENQHYEALTLVLCDLDGLKYINDTFSHTEGDNAIAVSAKALQNACQNGLCCRYGGDELIGIMTVACDENQIHQQIQQYLDDYNQHSGKPYQVSASIGMYTSADETFETMFEKADARMYQEKRQKPNRRK